MSKATGSMAEHIPTTFNAEPCATCGGCQELIPYQDASCCGSVTIELWRCEDCGQMHYGDTIDFGSTCDINADD